MIYHNSRNGNINIIDIRLMFHGSPLVFYKWAIPWAHVRTTGPFYDLGTPVAPWSFATHAARFSSPLRCLPVQKLSLSLLFVLWNRPNICFINIFQDVCFINISVIVLKICIKMFYKYTFHQDISSIFRLTF